MGRDNIVRLGGSDASRAIGCFEATVLHVGGPGLGWKREDARWRDREKAICVRESEEEEALCGGRVC